MTPSVQRPSLGLWDGRLQALSLGCEGGSWRGSRVAGPHSDPSVRALPLFLTWGRPQIPFLVDAQSPQPLYSPHPACVSQG